MSLWAIVPMKPLQRAKSRLAGVLSEEARFTLSRNLLVHTLEQLTAVAEIERVVVVSKDSDALALARDLGAKTITEHGASDLNKALLRATEVARGYGVSGLLVIPADLPLITTADIQQLIQTATDPPVIALAPDRHGQGTNAFLSIPTGLIEYDFGPESFHKHIHRAEAASVRVEICELTSFGLDIDFPDDLKTLEMMEETTHVDVLEEE